MAATPVVGDASSTLKQCACPLKAALSDASDSRTRLRYRL